MSDFGYTDFTYVAPVPTNTWTCDCGRTVSRYRGEGDQECACGQWYNACGQRLRSDWMDRNTYAEYGEEW